MFKSHMFKSHVFKSHMFKSHMFKSHMFKSHMFKSQVPTIKSQASLKSQYKQIKQVKSVAHLKQVKSSPDKGHVKSQYQTGTNIFFSHDLINFSSEINFFNDTF